MVYPQPSYGDDFRGKIPRREVFAVYEHVQGDPDCEGDGWGRISVAAYACLQHTTVTEDRPVALPPVPDGELAPFYYARRPKDGSVPSRWANRRALRAGAPPLDELQAERDYAFTQRRHMSGHGKVLSDEMFRSVREQDVRRMKPSDFRGRDLTAEPLRDDATLAWSVVWRYAAVRRDPDEDAPEIDRVLHHDTVYLDDTPHGGGRHPWYRLADGEGWVWGKEIQRLTRLDPPAEIDVDELWVDVDLQQQTLVVFRGEAPQYATLISSGSYKHPTPPGLYRITSKMAYSDMRSRPGDEESYYVEGVPWVMYFDGRYALHGTFWHNRFGMRTSHGCVNLSATDARWLFDRIDPTLPGGWLSAYAHPRVPGTLLRVRDGLEAPPDRTRD
jgi:hypothetical protein